MSPCRLSYTVIKGRSRTKEVKVVPDNRLAFLSSPGGLIKGQAGVTGTGLLAEPHVWGQFPWECVGKRIRRRGLLGRLRQLRRVGVVNVPGGQVVMKVEHQGRGPKIR